ncbi:protein kinase C-binding protein 1-like isoform X2 [Contarinia nasturtii]|nr:protein kinase C-binding protein 1-like isoform X2 [Contarinia nasturtii]
MSQTCSVSSESGSGEFNPSRRERAWDAYCWICHGNDAKIQCSTCIRAYHKQCITSKDATQPKSGFRCEVCIRMKTAIDDYAKRNFKMEKIHTMLGHITERLLEDNDFSCLGTSFSKLRKPVTGSGPNIINPFDLSIIAEKVEEQRYRTTLEFISDIRWIRHNAEIVLKEKDPRLADARKMDDLCEKEIYDIEMCDECFGRANTMVQWFTHVCNNPPHLPIWARLKGHPYWPAKVMGFTDQNHKKIDVRFFGKHDMGIVETSDCILFSDNPNKLQERDRKKMDNAIQEAKKYIKNIERKYSCKLVKPKSKSSFDANKIGAHLMEMIPGLNLPKNFKLKTKPDYLRRLRRRKAPNPKSVNLDTEHSYIQDILGKYSILHCSIRLEKCDNMLNVQQIEFIREINSNYSISTERINKSEPNTNENIPELPSDEHEKTLQNEGDQQPCQILPHQCHEENDELVIDSVNDNQNDHKHNNNDKKRSATAVADCEARHTSRVEEPHAKRLCIEEVEINSELNETTDDNLPRDQPAVESPANFKPNKVSKEHSITIPLKSLRNIFTRKAYGTLHMHKYIRNKATDDKKIKTGDGIVPKTDSSPDKNSQSNMDSELSVSNEMDTEPMESECESLSPESPAVQFESPRPDTPLGIQADTVSESQLEDQLISPRPDSPLDIQADTQSESQLEFPDESPNHSELKAKDTPEFHTEQKQVTSSNAQTTQSEEIASNAVTEPQKEGNNEQIEIRPNNDSSTQAVQTNQCSENGIAAKPSLPKKEHQLHKALKFHQNNSTKWQAENLILKEVLNQKTRRIHQLENEVKQKNEAINNLKRQYIMFKADHDIQLQKAIQETKKMEWCPICKKEVKMSQMQTCSKKCLLDLWKQNANESN